MLTITLRRLRAPPLLAAVAAPTANADTIFGLTSANRIVACNAATPGTTSSDRTITGRATGSSLLGIGRRPVDLQLYALGSSGNIHRLSLTLSAYVATNLGVLSATFTGSSYGFDFNPTLDRLRMVGDADQNLRINPNIMPPATIVDGAPTLNGQTPFDLLAA